MWLIHKLVHPFTIFATPSFLMGLMIYLVVIAFAKGIYSGVRSLSGVLLPLILITFIFIFQKELLERLGKIPTLISFSTSLAIGVAVMMVIHFVDSQAVPITELVLSGSFSILVFSYVSLEGNKMLSYYYGMISGFLVYIIFWGFPYLR
jgi:hypothetical protein